MIRVSTSLFQIDRLQGFNVAAIGHTEMLLEIAELNLSILAG